MKNRILGITVLLAVVALGFAFVVSCAPPEDTELFFINKTGVKITIQTDGIPSLVELEKAGPNNNYSVTKSSTKKGGDITILKIDFGNSIPLNKWDEYLDVEITTLPTQKKPPKGKLTLGSGTMTFKPTEKDEDGRTWDPNMNPAVPKISAISLDE